RLAHRNGVAVRYFKSPNRVRHAAVTVAGRQHLRSGTAICLHTGEIATPSKPRERLVIEAVRLMYLPVHSAQQPEHIFFPRDWGRRVKPAHGGLLSNSGGQRTGEEVSVRRKKGIEADQVAAHGPRIVAVFAYQLQ